VTLRLGAQPLGKHRRRAHGQLGIDHDVGFGVQVMTDPSGAGAIDRGDAGHVLCGVAQLIGDVRSTPSRRRVNTALADCHTMPKIMAVMISPTSGSASG
jgi:hypothetical protein